MNRLFIEILLVLLFISLGVLGGINAIQYHQRIKNDSGDFGMSESFWGRVESTAVEAVNEHIRETDYIGEYYGHLYPGNRIYTDKGWKKFLKKDIQDRVENSIKINGEWILKSEIIFYTDPYADQKREIESHYIITVEDCVGCPKR